jgi:lauroyl/myristoyl acyltransferase
MPEKELSKMRRWLSELCVRAHEITLLMPASAASRLAQGPMAIASEERRAGVFASSASLR